MQLCVQQLLKEYYNWQTLQSIAQLGNKEVKQTLILVVLLVEKKTPG